MKFRHISYRWYLFFTFSGFVITIISVFFILSYYRNVQNVYASEQQEIKVYADSIVNSLGQEMDTMSAISMNIVFSNAVRDSFYQFSRTTLGDSGNGDVQAHKEAWNLSDYVFITFGAFQRVRQVNMYTLNGYEVSIGRGVIMNKKNLGACSWYKPVMDLAGKKYVTVPVPGSQRGEYDLSLIRMFYDKSGLPGGITEVVQDCEKLFRTPSDLISDNPYLKIYVMDNGGRFLFPYGAGRRIDPLVSDVNNTKNNLLEIRHLDNYNWTIYVFESKQAVAKSLRGLKYYYLLLLCTILVVTTIICFLISNQLTSSIGRLSDTIRRFELRDVVEGKSVRDSSPGTRVEELVSLWETYSAMQEKLALSTKELLLRRSEETKIKMQLSQSFVEPHFLYNILNTISVMAEEDMDDEIIEMCGQLTSYLRYVSATDESSVTLEQELEMTKNYLEIMKIRYGQENFSYKIYCPDSLLGIVVPKFVIQPLTENIFKHAFTQSPPWEIKITAEGDGTFWRLKVTDNGGLLSDEKKNEILAQFAGLDMDRELSNMRIGGAGLKNTFVRIKMRYRDKAVFEVDNSVKGYTTVVIGGCADDGK
jgi:Predicted signal transduction protein with a C-terminal ATPase domain